MHQIAGNGRCARRYVIGRRMGACWSARSRVSADTPSVPLTIDDFARGGLDLFQESYVLTAYPFTVRPAGVVAKKGSLLPETVAAIRGAVPAAHQPREKRFRRRR